MRDETNTDLANICISISKIYFLSLVNYIRAVKNDLGKKL